MSGNPPTESMSRRRFLTRATALASVTATGGVTSLTSACSRLGATVEAPRLVAMASPDRVLAAGMAQRVPIGVLTSEKTLSVDDRTSLPIRVLYFDEVIDELEVAAHLVDHDHPGSSDPDGDPDHQHSDLQRYFPVRTTFPEPGIYDLEVDFGPITATLPIQAFDPSEVIVPLPGQSIPPIGTPTVANPSGVEQICTRFEPCPFHEHNLADLITAGRPVALLVATPALCQTAYCGPVVDTMIQAADKVGLLIPAADKADTSQAGGPGGIDDIAIVHAEVYANPDEVGGDYTDPRIRLAPAVKALGLPFEPVLFLIGRDGVLADRIDNVFDITEAIDALNSLAG